jgi:hypothetical protein
MQSFPPRRELDLARALELFMVMAEEHRRELGLSHEELEALSNASEEFEDALAHQTMLLTLMKTAIERKLAARRRLEKCLRPVKKGMREHLTEATDILAEVGLQPACENRRPTLALSTPVHVFAERLALTTIEIMWDSGGNRAGITYIIECSYGSGEWGLVGATTRRQFHHEIMGDAPSHYRIIAAHKGRSSEPSEGAPLQPMLRVA